MEMGQEHRKEELRQHEEFQKLLGNPDETLVVKDPDGKTEYDTELGFWKADGGVFVIEKKKNGYNRHDMRQFTNDFVDSLLRVRSMKFIRKE